MGPRSIYWTAIVGDDWPAIGPADWGALETVLRDGATVDVDRVEEARKDFEARVRASESLQPIKDEMDAQQGNSRSLAHALTAVAELVRDFAGLVHRIRNQILDIVDRATDDIARARRTLDTEPVSILVYRIVAAARDEVAEVVAQAAHEGDASWRQVQAEIAESLGSHRTSGAGNRISPRAGSDVASSAVPSGAVVSVPDSKLLAHSVPDSEPVQRGVDGDVLGGADGALLPGHIARCRSAGLNGVAEPADPVAQGNSEVAGAPQGPVDAWALAGHVDADRLLDAPPLGDSDTDGLGEVAGALLPGTVGSWRGGHTAAARAAGAVALPDDGSGVNHEPDYFTAATEGLGSGSSQPPAPTGGLDDAEIPILPIMVMPQEDSADAAIPRGGTAVFATPDPGRPEPEEGLDSSSEAQASTGAPDDSAPVGRDVPGADAPSAVQASSDGRVPAPDTGDAGRAHVASPAKAGRSADPESVNGGDILHNALGGAIAAAAAPAFEVGGERVDPDLVLACTILGGMLSALESSWTGVAYAVSVMRYPGGVRAFVTSNEGRGWLPAGVYLPRAIAIPGQVASANYSVWEGISDPARVLAEFALTWGARSGARLSALASSLSIEPDLRRALGEAPMAGQVPASAAMPLHVPGSGLVDRLGLIGAPRLVDRIERVPGYLIAASCVELARDAHERVGRFAERGAETLGAPELRERVLAAVRGGREVPAQWWEELRDIDDLLAATILARRTDVSRVPLGELRSERSTRSAPELTALRTMVFQRRCNELALMLALSPDRQLLRDAVYAHGQIVDHPVLTTAPPAAVADPTRAPA
jgi:hypothetical protein